MYFSCHYPLHSLEQLKVGLGENEKPYEFTPALVFSLLFLHPQVTPPQH